MTIKGHFHSSWCNVFTRVSLLKPRVVCESRLPLLLQTKNYLHKINPEEAAECLPAAGNTI